MNTSLVCVDASIVVDRLIQLDDPQLATLWDEWIKTKIILVAPLLIRYEVVNVLYQVNKKSQLSRETTDEAIRALNRLPMQLYSDAELHNRAFTMAKELALGATYDAHYLALASSLDCEFWTRDAKLARAAQVKYKWVRLLEHS
jgi:predicted nucleic acid-binding protein